jgi:hypothetical protein
MGTANATLGGVPLADTGAVSWSHVTGTAAPVRAFYVHASRWDQVKDLLGKPQTLVISSNSAPTLTWERLYPLREIPTARPMHRSFLVTDVRWLWQRAIFVRSMNIPRKTGSRLLVAGSIVELKIPYDIFGYARASLKDEDKKYTARTALEDALDEISSKCGHSYEIRGLSISDTPQITVEGADLGESAEAALARILRMIPQSAITIDREGNAVVFDATDREIVEKTIGEYKPTEAGGYDRIVDLAPIRPKRIHVYMHKQVEIRFDSEEESDDPSVVTITEEQLASPDPTMRNVLPLPDASTRIDGDDVPQGTWVDFRRILPVWNEDLGPIGRGVTPPPLTLASIRKYWFVLEKVYAPLGRLTLNAAESNWAARIAAIRAHYRQTYMIHEGWMRRIRDIQPIRIGAVDPLTGTRAHAQAWSQYTVEPTPKAYVIAALQNDPELQFYWMNVDNYPGYDGDLWDKPASPARVTVVDKDLGVLRVAYDTGPFGTRAQIHPSMMNKEGKTVALTRDLATSLAGFGSFAQDGRVTGTAPISLSDEFRIAMVVTAMPFTPNDEGRLYRYTVEPSEIKGYLSRHFEVAGGEGPDWHIVIPPTIVTAWYAIQSSVSARDGAKLLFGMTGAPGENRNEADGYVVVNNTQDPGPALLPAVARAVATAQWASFITQREGTRTIHLQPDVETVGSIGSVTHALSPDGRLLSTVSMPSERRPIDISALIAQHARPFVLGTIPDIKA